MLVPLRRAADCCGCRRLAGVGSGSCRHPACLPPTSRTYAMPPAWPMQAWARASGLTARSRWSRRTWPPRSWWTPRRPTRRRVWRACWPAAALPAPAVPQLVALRTASGHQESRTQSAAGLVLCLLCAVGRHESRAGDQMPDAARCAFTQVHGSLRGTTAVYTHSPAHPLTPCRTGAGVHGQRLLLHGL